MVHPYAYTFKRGHLITIQLGTLSKSFTSSQFIWRKIWIRDAKIWILREKSWNCWTITNSVTCFILPIVSINILPLIVSMPWILCLLKQKQIKYRISSYNKRHPIILNIECESKPININRIAVAGLQFTCYVNLYTKITNYKIQWKFSNPPNNCPFWYLSVIRYLMQMLYSDLDIFLF